VIVLVFAGPKRKGAINGVLNGQVGVGKQDPGDPFSNGAGRKSDCRSWNAYAGLKNAAERSGTGLPDAPPGTRNCDVEKARPNDG